MNILITGGTGFIGSKLVQSLATDQHTITVLTRSDRTSRNQYVSYRKWDGKKMLPAIGLYDVVINLAGAGIADERWSEERKQLILSSRVDTTRACVEYINASPNPPDVFVSGSAVGYYGGNAQGEKTEDSAPGDDFLADVCIQWEDEARKAICRTVLLRTGVVLGNSGGAFPLMSKAYKFFLGGKFGSGTQGFPWIHIDDEVAAIRFCMENETISGPVNLAAPDIVDQKTFSGMLGDALNRPDPFIVPKFMLDAVFGQRSVLFWGGQKVVPQKLLDVGYEFKYPQLTPALQSLVD